MNHPWVYIVLIGLVSIVASFIAPKTAVRKAPDMVKEMEETMEHFVSEIEEENKELLQTVVQMKNVHEQQMVKLSDKIEQLEKQNYALSQELKTLALGRIELQHNQQAQQTSATSQAVASYPVGNYATSQVTAVVEQDAEVHAASGMQMKKRYEKLFQLHDQGKSIEFIAKKLNLNKGEVQLIIQLAKQEEQSHV